MRQFYLGTHMPDWLYRLYDVPLFVSHRRLQTRQTLKRATTRWALDSGGYTELYLHGEFQQTPKQYAAAVHRYADQIGRMEWAAPQDWMCEPWVRAKTGLTVKEHQTRTLHNFLDLNKAWKAEWGPFPFVPVLQGWDIGDYWKHLERYENAGVPMTMFPAIGIGSICRRQNTQEIYDLIWELASNDVPLHGFGVKTGGMERYGDLLESADSMAWSFGGRYKPGCGPSHKTESNCMRYAMAWRDRVLAKIHHEEAAA